MVENTCLYDQDQFKSKLILEVDSFSNIILLFQTKATNNYQQDILETHLLLRLKYDSFQPRSSHDYKFYKRVFLYFL